MRVSRRDTIRGLAPLGFGILAGCAAGSADGRDDADIIAGPGGRLVFEPEALEIDAGDTVTWFFDSAGHNVSGRPGDSSEVNLPEGAEPFASYGADEPPHSLVSRGETFRHQFDIAGDYVYVCIPHASAGMTGRLTVEE